MEVTGYQAGVWGSVVGTVVSYFEHKRRIGGGKVRHLHPVAVEIVEALLALGGSAHRQAVADEIAVRRSGRVCPADAGTRTEIYAAFDAYLTWVATRRTAPLLWLPLGEGSYRWALTEAGLCLLQMTPPARRMVR